MDSQDHRQEITAILPKLVERSLEKYRKSNNGKLPTHILMYRDGVGLSMFEEVMTS